MNREDLRFLKTEENIKNTFLQCVEEKGFEKTRVSDICKTGKISRNTFYVHYEDKYELLESIYEDFEKEIIRYFTQTIKCDFQNMNIESSVNWCIDAIDEHFIFLRILLKCSKSEFSNIIKKIFFDNRFDEITSIYKQKNKSTQSQLMEAYIVEAFVGFIEYWINHYEKLSKNEVKSILVEMCSSPVKSFYNNVLK